MRCSFAEFNQMRFLLSTLLLLTPLSAQQTVAPTPEPTGNPRGENWDNYNIVNSFEVGYRFRAVGGSLEKYRSDVNFGNGLRLLGSSFSMNSKDGHGHFFDEVLLTTQGLGNDPYESATFRIQKNKLYRYDLIWRQNAFFNSGLTTVNATGQHFLDTTYDLQDHDLTLFPQSNLKFFIGYTRGSQNGAGLSTTQLFDSRGNLFPLFANIHRTRNEYRIGNEFRLLGARVNWMRGWEDFKEDSSSGSTGLNTGFDPTNRTTLTLFNRQEPYHGTSPYWRVGLFSDRKHYSVNGRFTYTSGQRAFVLDENAVGTSRFGASAQQQVVTAGNAQRPVATGNLTVSFFPGSQLSIVNHTAIYNVRTEGESSYLQFDNHTQGVNLLYFQYLGIRTIANETDANLQANKWLGVYAGYHYSNRRISSTEQTAVVGFSPDLTRVEQTNQLNSGIFGIRLRPAKGLTITADGEIGRADHPFTPWSDRNYQALGARLHYKLKNIQLTAYTRTNYNTNSVSLSSYSSHARTYSADLSWTPKEWVSLDAGYSKLHLNTVGGLAYFLNAQLIQGDQSYYFSNIHTVNLGLRFALRKRSDLYLGYSRVQDLGDGRSSPTGSQIGSALAIFQAAQTFPLTFQSPLARVSFRITEKIRWNAGYQYYGYRERFYNSENYRANTGFTSLLWAF